MDNSDIRSETDDFFRASADGTCPEQLPYSEEMLERRRDFRELMAARRLEAKSTSKLTLRGAVYWRIPSQITHFPRQPLTIVIVVALTVTTGAMFHYISNKYSNTISNGAHIELIMVGDNVKKNIEKLISEGNSCFLRLTMNGKSYQLPISNLENRNIYYRNNSKNKYSFDLKKGKIQFEVNEKIDLMKDQKNQELSKVAVHEGGILTIELFAVDKSNKITVLIGSRDSVPYESPEGLVSIYVASNVDIKQNKHSVPFVNKDALSVFVGFKQAGVNRNTAP